MDYLIPANSKKSQLIFNTFRPIDLGIVSIGVVITLILFFAIQDNGVVASIIKLIPISACLFLVMPVPFYHNVLVFLQEVFIYYTNPTRYIWRGWCATYVTDDESKQQK